MIRPQKRRPSMAQSLGALSQATNNYGDQQNYMVVGFRMTRRMSSYTTTGGNIIQHNPNENSLQVQGLDLI